MRCHHRYVATPTIPICIHCGKPPNASPSQIETWRDCQRKHAYSRVRPRGQNASAAYGERCHTIAEAWLRDGTPPDPTTPEGRTVLSGIHYLPMPRTPGLLIEHRATPTIFGVPWDMRLDYILPSPASGSVLIGDHKTTGDIAEHAKDTDTLSTTDPQGISYGYWAVDEFKVDFVVGQWTYYQRDAKAAARPVVFSISRTDVVERFAQMHVTDVLPMVRSRVLVPEELPRNLAACSKYGGCPYRDECLANVPAVDIAASALTKLRRAHAPKHQESQHMTTTATEEPLLNAILAGNVGNPPAPTALAFPPGITAEQRAIIEAMPPAQRDAVISALQAAPPPAPEPEPPKPVEVVLTVDASQAKAELAEVTAAADKAAEAVASVEKPKRGRPSKSVALEVLIACAQGGLPAENAREYLALAGGL